MPYDTSKEIPCLNKFLRKFIINTSFLCPLPKKHTLFGDPETEMLKHLDPHSVYMNADEIKKANEPLEGNFEGVGIQFQIFQDTIIVVHVIPGGPSQKVGVQDGDKIIFVDTAKVAGVGITNDGVFKKLRGKKGTKVTIKIKRTGEPELLDFQITRDKIPIFAIAAQYMATPDIGYVKLERFSATATEETRAAKQLSGERRLDQAVGML